MMDRAEVAFMLRDQAEDLSRLRFLIEAQYAILVMEDASLLDWLGQEADQLVATIERRDAELARWADAAGKLPAPDALQSLVASAAERTARAVLRLCDRMRHESRCDAERLAAVDNEWNRLATGYSFQRLATPSPVLVDRTA